MSDGSSRPEGDATGDIGLDLNRAIAESLSTLAGEYDGHNKNHNNNDTPPETGVKSENDDLALESVIGDVLGLLDFPGQKEAGDKEPLHQPPGDKEDHLRDEDAGHGEGLNSQNAQNSSYNSEQDAQDAYESGQGGQGSHATAGNAQNAPYESTENTPNAHYESTEDTHDAYNNDFDLEAVIGAAFKETQEKERLESAHSEEPSADSLEAHLKELLEPPETHEQNTEEEGLNIDLDAAIGDAFKSIAGVQGASQGPNSELLAPQEPQEEENDDLNLEEAIGDAFKSITAPDGQDSVSSREENAESEPPNDDDLNAMISASFKLLMDKESAKTTDVSKDASSLSGLSEVQDKKEDGVDLSSIVHNIVSQIAHPEAQDLHGKGLPISEDILQELALEITNQVQDHIVEDGSLKTNSVRNLPQIDDNVLEHFENEAHKDDIESQPRLDETSLKAALATVVRNAIENNATTLSDHMKYPSAKRSDEPQEADLEKLHMNEILQNAFTMAMENPQDLLSNMEVTEEGAAEKARSFADTASALYKMQTALPSSTSSFLSSLTRSDDINLGASPQKAKDGRISTVAKDIVTNIALSKDTKRKLSIAETLALHRSSMAAGKRDYSAMDVLKSTPGGPAANPQLSSVLSSLSSHINSTGGADNNLLQVIRQMTNALTSGRASKPAARSVADIVNSYKGKPEEASMVTSLSLARKVLLESSGPENKAVSMVERVLSLFGKSADLEVNFGAVKPEFVSSLRELVESAFLTFGPKGGRFLGDRPRADTPEYKERVRVENRERKKRWREENAERNKDNDLRSRVLKRATLMFGEEETPHKKAWADDEFNKRKSKRIAKVRRDDSERSKGFLEDSLNDRRFFKDGESSGLSQDPGLLQPITDIFHILSESMKDDKQAALAATSAATATTAAIYASNNHHDNKTVDSAVSSILASLLDGLGDSLRHSGHQSENYGNSNIFSRLSATIRDFQPDSAAGSSILDMRGLNIDAKKRKSGSLGVLEAKRQHSISPSGRQPYMENDKTSISKIASELDQIRNSISSSTTLWSSGSGLKMPHYKKPEISKLVKEETVSEETVSKVVVPLESPFISNKATFGETKSEAPLPGTPSGLRKPGSFQRPAFSKPKGRNMGFPPLYSASFRQS